MNALASHRRHPAAIAILLLLGLLATGGLYSLLAPRPAQASVATVDQVSDGKKLFQANCATCHGLTGLGGVIGPNLAGVGAASVDFQVGTGRMPPAGPAVQASRNDNVKFTDEQIAAMAAYVATLAPGPAVPPEEDTKGDGNSARGNQLFKVNCAMCHGFAGSGGALTRGKYAPSLRDISGKHIFEAMETGPQSMPVFSETNLSAEDKNDIITYLHEIDKNENPGGLSLGNLGPVSEGMFIWIFGMGVMVAAAVWLGAKAA